MKNGERALIDAQEASLQHLQVAGARNGAARNEAFEALLVLRSSVHGRRPRPELAALGWESRSNRLVGRK